MACCPRGPAASTRATQRVNNVAVTVQLIGMVSLTVLLFVVGAATGKLDFGKASGLVKGLLSGG